MIITKRNTVLITLGARMSLNKKLWSFNFGSLIAYSFVWLVSFGKTAPVPEFLHPYTEFILDFYPGVVTAIGALLITSTIILLMRKVFDISASDHPFWLILPTLTFIAVTTFSAFEMLSTFLYAAIPALMILALTAILNRLSQVKIVNQPI